MKTGTVRVLLVAGALIICVLLFIAPRTLPPDGGKAAAETEAIAADLTPFVSAAGRNLALELKTKHDRFMTAGQFDSLVSMWDGLRRPDFAAYFVEKQAADSNTAHSWYNAGNRYFYSAQFVKDKTEVPVIYQSAIRCYSRALKADPRNTDARIMLATCYVETSPDPMKGIAMLREVEKTDSNNLKLQLTFAGFSMKSGQLDKAIERFHKALRADSTYIEVYLHLADAYEQKGEMGSTVKMLKQFAARTDDPAARTEVNKYIEQLKTSIN
jgi:tetratricopeptide (TPR) repeat protein